jgi:hypothetical protein
MVIKKPKNRIRKHHPATHLMVPAERNRAIEMAANVPTNSTTSN